MLKESQQTRAVIGNALPHEMADFVSPAKLNPFLNHIWGAPRAPGHLVVTNHPERSAFQVFQADSKPDKNSSPSILLAGRASLATSTDLPTLLEKLSPAEAAAIDSVWSKEQPVAVKPSWGIRAISDVRLNYLNTLLAAVFPCELHISQKFYPELLERGLFCMGYYYEQSSWPNTFHRKTVMRDDLEAFGFVNSRAAEYQIGRIPPHPKLGPAHPLFVPANELINVAKQPGVKDLLNYFAEFRKALDLPMAGDVLKNRRGGRRSKNQDAVTEVVSDSEIEFQE